MTIAASPLPAALAKQPFTTKTPTASAQSSSLIVRPMKTLGVQFFPPASRRVGSWAPTAPTTALVRPPTGLGSVFGPRRC
eukprot:3980398-Lingulodinium_polyedra.AAC.1